jgi:hypothetical protein
MERQTGLGRSLEDVLDSLTPVEPDASAPGRVLFEPEDLEQQLDQLMADIRDLRERVQHLVGMIPDDAVVNGTATNGTTSGSRPDVPKKKKKNKKNKKNKKSEAKDKKKAKKRAATA